MEVMEAIRIRRSIRKYSTDPVNDSEIETLLDAARWAPSWVNFQCVRWIIVKDPDMKDRLADTLPSTNPAIEAVRTVPVLLVACAETGKAGFKQGEAVTDKGDWYMFDVASAAQNLMLAAVELGLGTVHVGLFDAIKVEGILKVPQGIRVVELIPLGHPAEQPKIPRRKELHEIVFKERYGEQ